MRFIKHLCLALIFARALAPAGAAERPNILWLSFEDTSAYELGCYGNVDVRTPNIDRLAREGVRFTQAWSNGVQCSPARSTIITGCYSPIFATDHHRQARPVPSEMFGFPRYLREAGYFTTNNLKMDYNASNFDKDAVWSMVSKSATYNAPGRAPGQPFFSVFNCGITHMSLLTTVTTEGRRDFARIGLDPAKLTLPPHVPDLPEIRSDYAMHLEGVQDVDHWVGLFLADLKEKNLADDTIVFVFSDHGGCLPRGKGFVFETGLHPPVIAYFPPKWRHLAAGIKLGEASDRLIGFVDFAPTILSLAGIKPPAYMHGQPVFGKFAEGVKPRDYNFGYTANREDNFSPARAVTDGDFIYIRNYTPRRPLALRNFFQWGMPGNLAWDTAALQGKLTKPEHQLPFDFTPVEQLFDRRRDYFNVTNLASDSKHAAVKEKLSRQLDAVLAQSEDIGFLPKGCRDRGQEPIYTWVRRTGYSIPRLQAAALRAANARVEDVPAFAKDLEAREPEFRYWAASGLAELAAHGKITAAPAALEKVAEDANDDVAAVANEALVYLGRGDRAVPRLLALLQAKSDEAHAALETMSLLDSQRDRLKPYIKDLKRIAAAGNLGKSANSVLANLGLFPPADMYAAAVKKGIKANGKKKPMTPLPTGAVDGGGDSEQE